MSEVQQYWGQTPAVSSGQSSAFHFMVLKVLSDSIILAWAFCIIIIFFFKRMETKRWNWKYRLPRKKWFSEEQSWWRPWVSTGAALSSLHLHIPLHLSPLLPCCSWTRSVVPLALWVNSVASRKVSVSCESKRREPMSCSLGWPLVSTKSFHLFIYLLLQWDKLLTLLSHWLK